MSGFLICVRCDKETPVLKLGWCEVCFNQRYVLIDDYEAVLDDLRQLFYCRIGMGQKVDEDVQAYNPELWRRIYKRLNPDV